MDYYYSASKEIKYLNMLQCLLILKSLYYVKRTVPKDHILYDCMYVKYPEDKSTEKNSERLICQSCQRLEDEEKGE